MREKCCDLRETRRNATVAAFTITMVEQLQPQPVDSASSMEIDALLRIKDCVHVLLQVETGGVNQANDFGLCLRVQSVAMLSESVEHLSC
jgi:hypothetical protein